MPLVQFPGADDAWRTRIPPGWMTFPDGTIGPPNPTNPVDQAWPTRVPGTPMQGPPASVPAAGAPPYPPGGGLPAVTPQGGPPMGASDPLGQSLTARPWPAGGLPAGVGGPPGTGGGQPPPGVQGLPPPGQMSSLMPPGPLGFKGGPVNPWLMALGGIFAPDRADTGTLGSHPPAWPDSSSWAKGGLPPMPAGRASPAPTDPFGGRAPGPMQGPPLPPPRAANPSRSGGAAAAPIDPYGGRTPLPDETQPPQSVGMGYYVPATGNARQAQYIGPDDPRWRRR